MLIPTKKCDCSTTGQSPNVVAQMPSVEQIVKSQFDRVYTRRDWKRFKEMAEWNLSDAARLRTVHITFQGPGALRARNSRKRLLIGVGVELLLKAIYLKNGYVINKPNKGHELEFPLKASRIDDTILNGSDTYTLNMLIQNIHNVQEITNKTMVDRGLRIAKVFRNKEGHVVSKRHAYDRSNYTDIANALISLYEDAFAELLDLNFSMEPGEAARWSIKSASFN